MPTVHPTAFIHPHATVLGNVTLGARASVWPQAVLRADTDRIEVGDDSNVQDGSVLHCDPGVPCVVGRRVTIGHRAIVHGTVVEDDCLIGMGAILLNHCTVGRGSIIAAGAVCPEGMTIPPNSLVMGAPAKVVRETTPDLRARIQRGADAYIALAERHRDGEFSG